MSNYLVENKTDKADEYHTPNLSLTKPSISKRNVRKEAVYDGTITILVFNPLDLSSLLSIEIGISLMKY